MDNQGEKANELRARREISVLTDNPVGTKSSTGSYGAAIGLGQSRQGLRTLNFDALAFGEYRRIDLLEEFLVQHFDASSQIRRRYHETHSQLRAVVGQNRGRNLLQCGQRADANFRHAVNSFSH